MNYSYDHDRFVNKNKGLAGAYEMGRKDSGLEKRGFDRYRREQDASCFNCKLRGKCPEYRKKRTGGIEGVVSYGGNETFICDRFQPEPSDHKSMNKRQIKSLLKNAKRGLR
ncbi:MAG: hypothetical protein ACLFSB_01075 [Chitinispirillaceae bacterium]